MTKQLMFGTLGPTGYFTAYVSKEYTGTWAGYVENAFIQYSLAVWYLDDEGKAVSEDAFSNVLRAIPIWQFIDAAIDDNGETDGEQWGDLPDWAENTDFSYVMLSED